MNALIKITYVNDNVMVSARELHEFLRVATPFDKWFPRMCEYGFSEGLDFSTFLSESTGGRPAQDAQLTISMAKELCMIQRTEKGKMARQYFIALENAWSTPEMVMARALKMADGRIQCLKIENSKFAVANANMQPKADYFDELVDRNLLTNFRETANELLVSQTSFINFLLDHKYIYRDGSGKIKAFADKNDRLFVLKESKNDKTGWVGVQTLIKPVG